MNNPNDTLESAAIDQIKGANQKALAGKVVDSEQPVTPQKPMSIEQYTQALKKEHEVARLRAGIAKFMFEENMAMVQLNQLRAGQHMVQQAQMPDNQPTEEIPQTEDNGDQG